MERRLHVSGMRKVKSSGRGILNFFGAAEGSAIAAQSLQLTGCQYHHGRDLRKGDDLMTWKEFKEKVEEQGVTDNMEMLYIDCDDQEDVHVDRVPDNQKFSVT